MTALRAFEAAARRGSFVAAAEELHVTPSAISQQIKLLEDHIGRPLFERTRQGVRLQPDAAAAFAQVQGGLQLMGLGLERLRKPLPERIVTLSVTPAFAGKWLLPRIERLRERHPQLELRLDSSNRLVDFVHEDIDLGVRYGRGRYPGLTATRLMGEDIFPVCSPALLPRLTGRPLDAALLDGLTLIHDSTFDFDPGFPTWTAWLAARGLRLHDKARGLHLNSPVLAIEAAIDGQGIALGRSALVEADLRAGRLVQALGERERSNCAYFVVHPERTPSKQRVSLVREWLLEEASIVNCISTNQR
jgi:LysR family transcriptional regulator, glycine cleavage system transcriptional activator